MTKCAHIQPAIICVGQPKVSPHFGLVHGSPLWAHNWPQWGPTLLTVGLPIVSPHFWAVPLGPHLGPEVWGPHVPRISRRYLGPQWAAHNGPTWAPIRVCRGPTTGPNGVHSTYCGPAHSQPTLVGCPTGAPPGSQSVGPTRAPHFTPVSGPTVGCPQWPHMGPYKGLPWAHNWPQWGPLYLLWACPQSAHTSGLSHWGPTWVPKCGAHTCPAFHAGIWARSGLPARAPFGPQRSLFAGIGPKPFRAL
ncbi:hypothetical protein F2P79_025948 [Pimephales promelas]|nr:hypothetical protein F2P79_025948 [Pimephales promelas]